MKETEQFILCYVMVILKFSQLTARKIEQQQKVCNMNPTFMVIDYTL